MSNETNMNKSSDFGYEIPILLLAFNRPDTTRLVLNQIRSIRPKRLYVAVDGPRATVTEDAARVSSVQNVVKEVDWDCTIKTRFLTENLGCRQGVSSAISWFFSHEEKGVILEDDCVPNLSFFNFCERMLRQYERASDVFMISGNNFLTSTSNLPEESYLSRYAHIWGWATWRRSWELYDIEMRFLPTWTFHLNLLKSCNSFLEYLRWLKIFQKVSRGDIGTWDYQVQATMFFHRMLSVVPAKNLVGNVGFGTEATHTMSDTKNLSNMQTFELEENQIGEDLKFKSHKDAAEYKFLHDGLSSIVKRWLNEKFKLFRSF